MRVLALSNLYPPHALGGYEWSCHDVMRRFHERGHDVAVLTTTTRVDGVGDDDLALPFVVERTLQWYWDDHELTSPSPFARARIEHRNQRALRAALERHRPHVVSVWNVGAMSHGLLHTVADAGIPMVYAVCDEWPVHGRHLDAWARVFTHRPLLASVVERLAGVPSAWRDLGPTGAWCFVSEYTRQICQDASDFSFPIAAVVHSGIEVDDFPLVGDVDGPAPFGWNLLQVGRLDERKGVLTAVDALARLPAEATLTFVGRGDAADAIRSRATAAGVGDRVTITATDRAELAGLYRAADAFLFTSEWAEPFGLTPIEAMACGTLVVGTGTGGSSEFLLDEVTCLRYPPGDAAALAAALLRLEADPDLRRRLRRGGAAVASQLTTERLAQTLERWHLAAAAGFPDGPPQAEPLLAEPPER